jgi:hypothetical protein
VWTVLYVVGVITALLSFATTIWISLVVAAAVVACLSFAWMTK